MTVIQKKRPIGAWWLLQSFERSQFEDLEAVIYVGTHKPRQKGTKDMEEVKSDPEAFLPKMDISVFTRHVAGESFPVYAKEMAKIIAGIKVINGTLNTHKKTISERVEFTMKFWMEGRNELPLIPYVEFDPNKTGFKQVSGYADKYGPPMMKYKLTDPMKRRKDVLWLKGAYIDMARPLRDVRDTFIHDVLVVGKDIKRNHVVLGMKKTFQNYSRIIPLHENGLNFLTSLYFMSNVRPSRYPLISPATLDRLVNEQVKRMKSMEFAYADFALKVNNVLDLIKLDDASE